MYRLSVGCSVFYERKTLWRRLQWLSEKQRMRDRMNEKGSPFVGAALFQLKENSDYRGSDIIRLWYLSRSILII